MQHLSELKDFRVLAAVDNAVAAFTFLQANPVDLVFLDIQMPGLSGIELIRSVRNGPNVILTTAYREYAATAFDLNVIDYLVKPITRERFMQSVSKYLHYHSVPELPARHLSTYEQSYMFFKTGREQTKIFLKDILFIEGFADYIKVHTHEKVFIASEKLGYMEEKLPEEKFIRVHKSFIIALDKLTGYTADQLKIAHTILPLGRLYKGAFFRKIQTGSVTLPALNPGV